MYVCYVSKKIGLLSKLVDRTFAVATPYSFTFYTFGLYYLFHIIYLYNLLHFKFYNQYLYRRDFVFIFACVNNISKMSSNHIWQ